MTSLASPSALRFGLAQDQSERTVPEAIVFFWTIVYLVLNRVIPDNFVVPVGLSLRVHEVALGFLLLAWLMLRAVQPLPMPAGSVGLFGLILVVTLTFAPFLQGTGLTQFQSNGAERGLQRLALFVGLFLAGYHLAQRKRLGKRVLAWWLGLTAAQALLSLWELVTTQRLVVFDKLATAIGLVVDPKTIRPERDGLDLRLTGEVRAATTAPIEIVLSMMVALGALLAAGWMLGAKRTRERVWAGIALACCLMGLPASNSRTGFVVLIAVTIPMFFALGRFVPRIVPVALLSAVMLIGAFVLSPSTARLLLNSVFSPSEDPNVVVRVERFNVLPELMEPRYALGAGFQTHDVSIQLFDNAYNLGLIEFGIVGLALVLVFFGVVFNRCRRGLRLAAPDEMALPLAGFIAVLSLLVSMATFDALSFDQYLPSCILLMGLGAGRSTWILNRAQGGGSSLLARIRGAGYRPRAVPRLPVITGEPSLPMAMPVVTSERSHPTTVPSKVRPPVQEGDRVVQLIVKEPRLLGETAVTITSFLRNLYRAFVLLLKQRKLGHIDEIRVVQSPTWVGISAAPFRLLGTRVIIEATSPAGATYVYVSRRSRRHPATRLIRLAQSMASRFVTRVVVSSERLSLELIDEGVPARKIYIDRYLPGVGFPRGGALSRSREPGPLRLVMHGGLASPADVRTALRAVDSVRGTIPVELRLILKPGERDWVSAEVISSGLSDVVFVLRVPESNLAEVLSKADVGVALLDAAAQSRWIMPEPLIDYVYLGLPVVATQTEVIRATFTDKHMMLVRPRDHLAVGRALIALRVRGALRRNLASGALAQLGAVYTSEGSITSLLVGDPVDR